MALKLSGYMMNDDHNYTVIVKVNSVICKLNFENAIQFLLRILPLYVYFTIIFWNK